LASRIAGSSDLYSHTGRKPTASINFITAHDGFCLEDLVSYNHKHNDMNGEGNNDGNNDNFSWNHGAEGSTEDVAIQNLRWRQKANMMATMMLSLGTPMIIGGDELSRTQQGNNNTYCQDNELNYYNWALSEHQEDFLEAVKLLIHTRKTQPVLQRRKYFEGRASSFTGLKDITWFHNEGRPMREEDWHNAHLHAMGYILEGTAINELSQKGETIRGDTLCVLINAQFDSVTFKMPFHKASQPWTLIFYTGTDGMSLASQAWNGGEEFQMEHHTLALFVLSKHRRKGKVLGLPLTRSQSLKQAPVALNASGNQDQK